MPPALPVPLAVSGGADKAVSFHFPRCETMQHADAVSEGDEEDTPRQDSGRGSHAHATQFRDRAPAGLHVTASMAAARVDVQFSASLMLSPTGGDLPLNRANTKMMDKMFREYINAVADPKASGDGQAQVSAMRPVYQRPLPCPHRSAPRVPAGRPTHSRGCSTAPPSCSPEAAWPPQSRRVWTTRTQARQRRDWRSFGNPRATQRP